MDYFPRLGYRLWTLYTCCPMQLLVNNERSAATSDLLITSEWRNIYPSENETRYLFQDFCWKQKSSSSIIRPGIWKTAAIYLEETSIRCCGLNKPVFQVLFALYRAGREFRVFGGPHAGGYPARYTHMCVTRYNTRCAVEIQVLQSLEAVASPSLARCPSAQLGKSRPYSICLVPYSRIKDFLPPLVVTLLWQRNSKKKKKKKYPGPTLRKLSLNFVKKFAISYRLFFARFLAHFFFFSFKTGWILRFTRVIYPAFIFLSS